MNPDKKERLLAQLTLSQQTFGTDIPSGASPISATQEIATNQLESLLITIAEPPFNKQGAQWSGAVEYLQATESSRFDPKSARSKYAYTFWLGPRAEDWGYWGTSPNSIGSYPRALEIPATPDSAG